MVKKYEGISDNILENEYIVGENSGTHYIISKINSSAGATSSYFAKRKLDKKQLFLKHYKPGEINHIFFRTQQELYERLYQINRSHKNVIVEKNYEFFEIKLGKFKHHFQAKEMIKDGYDLTNILYKDSKNYIGNLGTKLKLAKQVLSIMLEIHNFGVVHTDLKPEQIMLVPDKSYDSGYQVIFIDFDHALYFQNRYFNGKFAGTSLWKSPEHLRGGANIGYHSDTFTIAMIIYIILCGTRPYNDDAKDDIYKDMVLNYKANKLNLNVAPLQKIEQILHKALNPDETKRATLQEIIKEF
jgi:serine/threonine protein kinase